MNGVMASNPNITHKIFDVKSDKMCDICLDNTKSILFHIYFYLFQFSRLEGHKVPSESPVDPGNDLLVPTGSSPDMDDVSSKRQATR